MQQSEIAEFPARRQRDANQPARLALIGCGLIGEQHALAVANVPDARFVAFVDQNEAAAERFKTQFGGEYATTDASRIWADDSIVAVYICTRHDSHAALAIQAARAGKHILVEKPLALNLEDCEAIAAAVRESGVFLMPAFKLRFYPLVQMAHEFIPRPQVLMAQMMDDRWPDDCWAQDPVQGGANVASQGCHAVDLLRYFADSEPHSLWAAGGAMTHPEHACIDQCVASIRFHNGSVASWIQGDAAMGHFTGKFFFGIFGEGKSVQLYDRCTKAVFSDGTNCWTEERDSEEGIELENIAFINSIRSRNQCTISLNDGMQATRIVLAAERATRSGEVQYF